MDFTEPFEYGIGLCRETDPDFHDIMTIGISFLSVGKRMNTDVRSFLRS